MRPLSFVCACFMLAMGAGSRGDGQALPELSSAGSPRFEVVGEDRRSVSFVHDLGVFIARRHATLLDLPEAYPQRVLVSLIPPGPGRMDEAWRLRVAAGGFVSLDVRWDASLQLETLCHALTAALVVRQAIYVHGPGAGKAVKGWIVSAQASDAYLALRPAMRADFRRECAIGDRAISLNALLSAPVGMAGVCRTQRDGYLFWKGLQSGGWSKAEVAGLMAEALGGGDVLPSLVDRMGKRVEAVEPEVWWRGWLEAATFGEGSRVDDLRESRLWIGELSRFDFDGVESSAGFRELWLRRDDPDLQAMLDARLALLRLRIPSVNPAYHNAAQSLGALFETVAEGEARHRFAAALSRFLVDYEDAKRLEEDVAAMGEPLQRRSM